MKKILLIIFFILSIVFVCGGQMPVGEITAQQYMDSSGQMAEQKTLIKYDARNKTTYIYFEDIMGDFAMALNEKNKKDFLVLCNRFLLIAAGKTDSDMEKQQRLGIIITSLYFIYGNKWHMSKPDVPVFVSFLPQAEYACDLALSFGRAVSMKDKAIQRSASDRYITEYELKKLVEILTKK